MTGRSRIREGSTRSACFNTSPDPTALWGPMRHKWPVNKLQNGKDRGKLSQSRTQPRSSLRKSRAAPFTWSHLEEREPALCSYAPAARVTLASPEARTALGNQRAAELLRGWEIPVPGAGDGAGIDGGARAVTALPGGTSPERRPEKGLRWQPLNGIRAGQTGLSKLLVQSQRVSGDFINHLHSRFAHSVHPSRWGLKRARGG